MHRKILALCITILLAMACVVTAAAAEFEPDRTGSIRVTLTDQKNKTPMVGAELSLYHVATVGVNTHGNLSYGYTEYFLELGIPLKDPQLTEKLDAHLFENKAPVTVLYTDENGTACWEQLPLGLYLVRQTEPVEGFSSCAPFLVTVPAETGDGYVYTVNASPKTEVAKLTDITIKKVWNTDASTKAADSVTVQLLRGGQVVETAVLSQENNWQITYEDMPESDSYKVKEVNVPKGFTATYKQKAYVFTVTNTSTLAQTGQVIWPIPVLAFAGVVLIGTGCVLLRKKREENG